MGPATPIEDSAPPVPGSASAPSGQEACPSLGGNGSVRWAQGQLLASPRLGTRFQWSQCFCWKVPWPGPHVGEHPEETALGGIGLRRPFLFMGTGTVFQTKSGAHGLEADSFLIY